MLHKTAKVESISRLISQLPREADIRKDIKAKRGKLTFQSRAGDETQRLSLGQRAAFKTEVPHLAGKGADQTKLQLNTTATAC
jgi:hypothetical protein